MFSIPSETMNASLQPTAASVVPSLRPLPREGGAWSWGGEWFARLIGFQLLVVSFALAGSWSRTAPSPALLASETDEDVPVIDFPVEQAGAGPTAVDMVAEVPNPVEAVQETSVPDLLAPAPVELQAADAPVPDLVEALPAPPLTPPAVIERPVDRTRTVATTGSNLPSRPSAPSASRPAASGAGGGGNGTAESPVLFGSAGTGRFPLPPYPTDARRRGIEGNVMLLVEVSAGGQPDVPRIESSSGSSALDRAAVSWIRARWRWEPGPVRHYRIPISYQIR